MLWTKVRTARKRWLCDHCERKRIEAGDRYLESTIAPGHEDVGNQSWWRMRECEDCAERYGRWPA